MAGPLKLLRRAGEQVGRAAWHAGKQLKRGVKQMGKRRLSLVHVLIALPVGALGVAALWRRWANAIRREYALQITRKESAVDAIVEAEAGGEGGLRDNDFLKALALDSARLKEEPFNASPLCSLLDYFLSLDTGDDSQGVSAERIFISLLDNAGMGALLPIAHLAAPAAAQQALPAGGNGFTGALFRKLLSPLKIYAISTALSEATSDMAELESVTPAIQFFTHGEPPEAQPAFPGDGALPAEFVLDRDLPAILTAWGLSGDAAPLQRPEPTQPLLPDLCFSYAELQATMTPWKGGASRIMSKLFNRLSANAMPDAHLHGARRVPLTVWLTEKERAAGRDGITSPEELLLALHAKGGKGGHDVRMGMVSRATSFGYGLSVRGSDGGYTNIPVMLPLETGLELLESSDPSGAKERIIMPACHAGIFLDVDGPLVSFGIEWYQGIEGFTGWHNANDYVMSWANSPEVSVRHDDPAWTTPAQWRAALETTTVAATALNVTASLCKLPNGGYGYLGICMDSVAAVQSALTGKTSLFPLILSGHVKARVMLLYKELERELGASGRSNLASAAAALRLAMASLPSDVIHQPRDTDAICDRLLAMLPQRSPFRLIGDCERKVALLKAQVAAISNDNNRLGRTFSQTRAKSFQKGMMAAMLRPSKSSREPDMAPVAKV